MSRGEEEPEGATSAIEAHYPSCVGLGLLASGGDERPLGFTVRGLLADKVMPLITNGDDQHDFASGAVADTCVEWGAVAPVAFEVELVEGRPVDAGELVPEISEGWLLHCLVRAVEREQLALGDGRPHRAIVP